MNFSNFEIIIKLSSKKRLEIFISKRKETTEVVEAVSELLPFFSRDIEIDKSSNDYYKITGKDDLGKFAVLNTIIEEIADSILGLGSTPDFYI